MAIALAVKTAPATEPVTLDEVRAHLRVDFNDDDALITTMMKAARRKIETTYFVSCISQELVLTLDRFIQPGTSVPSYGYPMMGLYGWGPGIGPWGWMTPTWSAIDLRPPVSSITSITYVDPTGALQTLASNKYTLAPGTPGRVFPAINNIWPVTAVGIPGSVSIDFISGFATADLVPDDWKLAIKLSVGSTYENREQTVIGTRLVAVTLPDGIDDLMASSGPMLVR
jgi:Phage gp6-like head-tail connector protein